MFSSQHLKNGSFIEYHKEQRQVLNVRVFLITSFTLSFNLSYLMEYSIGTSLILALVVFGSVWFLMSFQENTYERMNSTALERLMKSSISTLKQEISLNDVVLVYLPSTDYRFLVVISALVDGIGAIPLLATTIDEFKQLSKQELKAIIASEDDLSTIETEVATFTASDNAKPGFRPLFAGNADDFTPVSKADIDILLILPSMHIITAGLFKLSQKHVIEWNAKNNSKQPIFVDDSYYWALVAFSTGSGITFNELNSSNTIASPEKLCHLILTNHLQSGLSLGVSPHLIQISRTKKLVDILLSHTHAPVIAHLKHEQIQLNKSKTGYGLCCGKLDGLRLFLAPLSNGGSEMSELLNDERLGELILSGDRVSPGKAAVEDGHASLVPEEYLFTNLTGITHEGEFYFCGQHSECIAAQSRNATGSEVIAGSETGIFWIPVFSLELMILVNDLTLPDVVVTGKQGLNIALRVTSQRNIEEAKSKIIETVKASPVFRNAIEFVRVFATIPYKNEPRQTTVEYVASLK